jgi:hypothetical protein
MKNIIEGKKKDKGQNPFNNSLCDKSMKFEECELAILRNAVDINEQAQEELKKEILMKGNELTAIFDILENFIIRKKLVLYGGFAINAVLPEYAKFYNLKHDIPDYDCYSSNALEDAIELADFFFKKGYKEVEAKAGVHYGTYKVYVNFIAIADITLLDKSIFKNIQNDAIIINKIHYCPVNFLRRNIYKELCLPLGDVSRWEKVFKRLNTINIHYPMTTPYNCKTVKFQRKLDSIESKNNEIIYNIVREAFIFMGAVFFGGYACSLYSQYMPPENRKLIEKIPDFDVLYEDIDKGSLIIKEKLYSSGFKNVKLIKHLNIGEIIPTHYEIRVGQDIVAFIYEPTACYSYNTITHNNQKINIATIDTILYFYFSFYYSNNPYYYKDRILCMAKILFEVEQENRLNQTGLLKRFTSSCIGNQEDLIIIRQRKTDKFKELINKRETREYMSWFLKYNPALDKRPRFMKKYQYMYSLKPQKQINWKDEDWNDNPRKNETNKINIRTTRKKTHYNREKYKPKNKNVFGWK